MSSELEKGLIPGVVSVEEAIAKSIVAIGDGVKKMKANGLNERLIILLLHDASGVPKGEIKKVITGMESLEKIYLGNETTTKRRRV